MHASSYKFTSVLLWILCTCSQIKNQSYYSFVLFWNTGQGQWITALTPDKCIHFDFGGEVHYWKKNEPLFMHLCKNKLNVLYLSHTDKDHYAYLTLFQKKLKKLCWAELRPTSLNHLSKKIPLCKDFNKLTDDFLIYRPAYAKSKNDSSAVYHYKSLLLPGDSTKAHEKIWCKKLDLHLKYLVLGHHGSKTSTSEDLLKKLSHIYFAIVQARYKKYKHPHHTVVSRLKKHKIPLIRTEDWGNILFEL
ncbi:MAG: ComEC/Rec2 family competence protein [Pseudobdellovibrio sp.]